MDRIILPQEEYHGSLNRFTTAPIQDPSLHALCQGMVPVSGEPTGEEGEGGGLASLKGAWMFWRGAWVRWKGVRVSGQLAREFEWRNRPA